MPQVYVATQGFVALRGGTRVRVHAGDTVDEGHWLLGVRGDVFRPQNVTHQAPTHRSTSSTSDAPRRGRPPKTAADE